jgi:PAS domain S-box-containing protein
MTLNLLLFTSVSALNLGLGLLVYWKNPHLWVNRIFAFFAFAVAGWTLGTSLGNAYAGDSIGLLAARFAFAMAALSVYALLLFFQVFPSERTLPRSATTTTLGVLTGILVALSLSPWIVTELAHTARGLKVAYGFLYPAYALHILSCVGYSIAVLFRKIGRSRGMERVQFKYLFFGLLVPGLLATITNLLIPLLFGTSQFSQYGPLFSFAMIALIAHAIVRHRLLNIRLVIRRGVVLLLAVTIAGTIFVALLALTSTLVFSRSKDLPIWLELSLVLLIALLFQPLRRWIQTSLDRYLYRESYDYQRILREATTAIGSILDLKSLLNYVSDVLTRALRPELLAIYIRSADSSDYRRMTFSSFTPILPDASPDSVPSDGSSFLQLLIHSRPCLLRDDLRHDPSPNTHAILHQLDTLQADLVLPIVHEERLTGFVVLGPKLSGDPYFSEDIDLLSTIIGQAAIALENARLYREVTLVNEYVTNIVASMESGVIAADPNGSVTLFNPSAERITGVSRHTISSKMISRLPSALADPLAATLADGLPRFQAETLISGPSDHYVPISYATHALRDPHGHVLGVVGVFSDLTRLKQLETEKRRAERLASIGALASGIAHEIKNPLVAIKTFAELLPERFTEEDFRDDFSKVVIREIERIDDLVARLRGLAAPSVHPVPLDLREPIEETLSLLRGQLEQKKIRVRRIYDKNLTAVAGDPAQLKQLFLNLFMNALEAMNRGGQLTIELQRGLHHGAPTVLTKVSDTGSGIPESMLGKIFDPFVTTKPRGSGLGLAICRGIADAHGATIRATNNLASKGSTLTVEFPAVAPIAASTGVQTA